MMENASTRGRIRALESYTVGETERDKMNPVHASEVQDEVEQLVLHALKTQCPNDLAQALEACYPLVDRNLALMGLTLTLDRVEELRLQILSTLPQKLSKYKPGSFHGWLYTVTKRHYFTWLRKHRREFGFTHISISDPNNALQLAGELR